MKIGYARVSAADGNLPTQRAALHASGCERVFEDTGSGSRVDRPALAEALAFVCKGDELIVWKLDRIGRSLPQLVKLVEELRRKKVGFRSLSENIRSEASSKNLATAVFAALAEFEHDLVRERTHGGLAAARARGRKGGRKPLPAEKIAALQALWAAKTLTAQEIGDRLGIHRSTVFKYARANAVATMPPARAKAAKPGLRRKR